MLRILLIAAAVLAAIVVVLLVYAATKPGTFRVERSILIDAPPGDIYAEIEDFRRWRAWSPYEDRDPNLERSYSGAEKGVGAQYAWQGDSNVGSGRMEIRDAVPASEIVIALDFLEPMEAHNMAFFTMTPEAGATRLAWVMEGPSNLMFNVMGIFVDMDAMIGTDFEAGLAKMKSNLEEGEQP
ncbi:MAG: SRPBCC family protein [Parvibaculum sp.]|uniref:SRPBCC family protein n=1 Tax=Parvibaculum sp. TaxID=2024848 RepID=UPI0034A05A11